MSDKKLHLRKFEQTTKKVEGENFQLSQEFDTGSKVIIQGYLAVYLEFLMTLWSLAAPNRGTLSKNPLTWNCDSDGIIDVVEND